MTHLCCQIAWFYYNTAVVARSGEATLLHYVSSSCVTHMFCARLPFSCTGHFILNFTLFLSNIIRSTVVNASPRHVLSSHAAPKCTGLSIRWWVICVPRDDAVGGDQFLMKLFIISAISFFGLCAPLELSWSIEGIHTCSYCISSQVCSLGLACAQNSGD